MITANNLSKCFKLYASPADRLKEIVFRSTHHKSYQALDNVSFKVEAGQTLGVLGPNGAGKSTLLKLITGILLPDSGSLHIEGKVTGLLELGTGFNPQLTGRDNIAMNGLLLGMSSEEIAAKEAQIIDFADLGMFIDEVLSTYSSGMVMRLAFAIAINADPACFLIDEALSVGDAGFQQKCMRRIKEFKSQGGAIIFVSHDMNAVKQLCDSAILLDHGVVTLAGEPDQVVNEYSRLLSAQNHDGDEFSAQGLDGYGTFEAKIESVTIDGQVGVPVVNSGDRITLRIDISANADMANLACGIIIRDKYGQDIYGTNTYLQDKPLAIKRGAALSVSFELAINVGVGTYTVGAAIQAIPTEPPRCLNWGDNLLEFEVIYPRHAAFVGLCRLEPEVRITTV